MNRAAADLVRGRLRPESRVLVLGAGGWFGSTLLDLIARSGCGADVLALTGRPRRLAAGEQVVADPGSLAGGTPVTVTR